MNNRNNSNQEKMTHKQWFLEHNKLDRNKVVKSARSSHIDRVETFNILMNGKYINNNTALLSQTEWKENQWNK